MDNVMFDYIEPIIISLLVLIIAIVVLKNTHVGCKIGFHKWNKQEGKVPSDPKYAYLYRGCKQCTAFQTKSEGSNYRWVTHCDGNR